MPAQAALQRAREATYHRDVAGAAKAWQQVVDEYPDYHLAQYQLAQQLFRQGRAIAAREVAERALLLSPRSRPDQELLIRTWDDRARRNPLQPAAPGRPPAAAGIAVTKPALLAILHHYAETGRPWIASSLLQYGATQGLVTPDDVQASAPLRALLEHRGARRVLGPWLMRQLQGRGELPGR